MAIQDKDPPPSSGFRRFVGTVVLFSVGMGFGAYLYRERIHAHIESVSASKIAVDGTTLDACNLGCRTEDDKTCSAFVNLVRRQP